jgi:hypothetical protein
MFLRNSPVQAITRPEVRGDERFVDEVRVLRGKNVEIETNAARPIPLTVVGGSQKEEERIQVPS